MPIVEVPEKKPEIAQIIPEPIRSYSTEFWNLLANGSWPGSLTTSISTNYWTMECIAGDLDAFSPNVHKCGYIIKQWQMPC